MADGGILDVGEHRLQWIDTPHVPHAWEAGLLYDEVSRILFCGDLFARMGSYEPVTEDDILSPAVAAEDEFATMSLHPQSGAIIRRLADLDVDALALMHGPVFNGDCRSALLGLAGDLEGRIARARG